ncbi:high-affinity iron transporter [Candidatus Thorarchaeota archaeon]|nr:MAG: high-affinity iron transporter [Candidatus Thorarchaeota archaeon]
MDVASYTERLDRLHICTMILTIVHPSMVMAMFVGPMIISLREGIEAALIISIMLSYLIKTRQESLKKYVIYGSGVAMLASVGVAAVLAGVYGILEGEVLALFEGVMVILAALLLTTMIVWMRSVGHRLAAEIRQSMDEKIVIGGALGLASLTFALILREGVELALFTVALAVQDPVQTYLGVALGLALAVVIGVGIYRGSLRISMSTFFRWTSFFLILFAAGMVAYGIHELQEAGYLLIGPLEVWNINPSLLSDGSYPLLHDNGLIGGLAKALFGYNGNPSGLEVVGYVSFLGILGGYFAYDSRKRGSPKTESEESIAQPTKA